MAQGHEINTAHHGNIHQIVHQTADQGPNRRFATGFGGGKSPMHYVSAQVILNVLLTSQAARNARSRGDIKSNKDLLQADIPKDVYLPKALATPAPFLFPTGFYRLLQNTPNPDGGAALKCIRASWSQQTAEKSQKINQIDRLRLIGGHE